VIEDCALFGFQFGDESRGTVVAGAPRDPAGIAQVRENSDQPRLGDRERTCERERGRAASPRVLPLARVETFERGLNERGVEFAGRFEVARAEGEPAFAGIRRR
jgi:hypothetical protein